jgi:predicted Zn-dependent protease
MVTRRYSSGRRSSPWLKLIIAGVMVVFSLISYFGSSQTNPTTGEVQHIDITPEQEISLGLQAAPEIAAQFGGLDPSQADQQVIDRIGMQIINSTAAGRSPYEFDFHLLGDSQTINAFALPGGQVFITRALYNQLQTEDELAGVLGHEIGHVVGRHSAEQLAKAKLTEGLTGAAVIASYDPDNPGSVGTAQMAAMIGQLINLRYGREDELESDFFGVCFMAQSGHDPRAMIDVMEVLQSASGPSSGPEWLSTHPNPGNRIEQIQADIQNLDQCP